MGSLKVENKKMIFLKAMFLSFVANMILMNQAFAASCRDSFGAFFDTYSEPIHFLLLIPVGIHLIVTIFTGESGWVDRVKNAIPILLVIYALTNQFITRIIGMIC